MASKVPDEHRALVLESIEAGIQLRTVQCPRVTHGSALVRILAAQLLSYHKEIYNGTRQYSFPTPLIPGCSAIARIIETGPDATILAPGQLVFVDCMIHARDDPSTIILSGCSDGWSVGSKSLMRDVWRDGAFAEYRNVPLETCFPLNETLLCGSLGYLPKELMYLGNLLVPYGGLHDIGVEPGQTVIVCPATGSFGGAGVHVATALGCRVIAMGRNEKELARLKSRIESTMPGSSIATVPITSSLENDTAALQSFGTVDAILDLSPPAAAQSHYMKAALTALKNEGRISVMGFCDLSSSPEMRFKILTGSIMCKGKFMYSRSDVEQFVKILERGLFPKRDMLVESKSYSLDDWGEAFDIAANWTGIGRNVVIEP